MLKLQDFLPVYPIYDQDYNDEEHMFDYYGKPTPVVNYLKKEFYETKLEPTEDKPKTRGSLLKHQSFISRFMSPLTMNNGILLYHSVGSGKCHGIDTPIIMFNGKMKKVQDIEVGDLIMGDDSTSRTVLSLSRGKDEMYDIVPVKGEKHTVNSEHILCLKYSGINDVSFVRSQKKFPYKAKFIDKNTCKLQYKSYATREEAQQYLNTLSENDKIIEISVKNYLNLLDSDKRQMKLYRKSIDFQSQDVSFDPYIIGYWLGDGGQRDPVITSQDSTVLKYIRYKIVEYKLNMNYQSGYSYRISADFRKKIILF